MKKIFYYKKLMIIILIVGIILGWSSVSNIKALTEVNFTTNSLDWGAGSVNPGESSAILDSEAGTVIGGNWTSDDGELILENIGSENVTLDVYSDKDADDLVGGSASLNSFQWKMAEVEAGSCVNITNTEWTEVNTTSPGTRICDLLYANDTKDSIKIDFKIVIPSDTTVEGAQTATITATATAI